MPKHNQSVGRIPERGQAKDYYAKDYKRSCFGSEIKGRNSRNLTSCTNTHDRLKVRNASRICQKTIKPLSTRWAPTNKSCTSKTQNEKWKEAFYLQILELTRCSHVGLFVDSHPKVTCQTQEISGSHTWAPTNKSCTSQTQNVKWEEAFYLQILELTLCSHVGLFVDSHSKFTCQTQ